MKKYLTLLSLFIAVTAFAADKYITSSGKLILKSGSASTIEVQSTITGPGVVPVGGMVAVMPTTQATDTWQPPATGVIKDGFMRANGHTVTAQNVTDGSLIRAGTVLPNMVGSFPKGATTSGTTTAASKLVAANIPQVSTSYTPNGTNAASSVSGTADTNGAHSHNLSAGNAAGAAMTRLTKTTYNTTLEISGTTTDGVHGHTLTATAAAQGFTGTAATITVGTAVGSQTTVPEPVNLTVVWVIRVK